MDGGCVICCFLCLVHCTNQKYVPAFAPLLSNSCLQLFAINWAVWLFFFRCCKPFSFLFRFICFHIVVYNIYTFCYVPTRFSGFQSKCERIVLHWNQWTSNCYFIFHFAIITFRNTLFEHNFLSTSIFRCCVILRTRTNNKFSA